MDLVLASYLTQRITSEGSVGLLCFNSCFIHPYFALADHHISVDLP